MNKWGSIFLAATLIGLGAGFSGGASGAAARAPGSPSVQLQVFLGQITTPPGAQTTVMKQFIAKFEKLNPSISVQYSTYSSASQETTTLETSLATHTGPSLFQFGSTIVPVADSTHGFINLTAQDWKAAGGKSRFFPAQLKMSGPTAKRTMAIPEFMLPFALLYNKAMFKAAHIKSPPKTWSAFVSDAQKLTKPASGQWGVAMDPSDPFDPWHILWLLARQQGGGFISKDGKTATMDSPIVKKSFQFWFDWMTNYKIADTHDVTFKSVDQLAAFEQQHAAMLVMQGATLTPSLESSPVKNDWAFAPMPTIPYGMTSIPKGGAPVRTFISGQFYAIPAYDSTAVQQAALKWINFVTSVPQQRTYFKYYGYLPVNAAAYKNYPPLDTPVVKSFVAAENKAYPTPWTGAWGPVEVAVGAASAKIAGEVGTGTFKSGDIDAALTSVNADVQKALAQP